MAMGLLGLAQSVFLNIHPDKARHFLFQGCNVIIVPVPQAVGLRWAGSNPFDEGLVSKIQLHKTDRVS